MRRTECQIALFDAPAIVYLTVPKTASAWAIYDAGALTQSLMLAAKERGIDSMVAYDYEANILHAARRVASTEPAIWGSS